MNAQTIVTPAGERLVLIPEAEYAALIAAAKDAADNAAFDRIEKRLASGEEELIPSDIVDRLLDGENRVRVWREHRGLSAKQLAEKAGIAKPFLSQIETGKREGTVDTLRKIADALSLTIDDLVG
ncbi:helix-turn-helix transcriptional regulator [Methylobacterium sp. SD274]|uniref:helix-turn-helix domain-containing protein n=1 Tax=Methylobacterium sp. SD274 TaxID=2782009 RepID=UPI001A958041|nr:helix-turn-helix transcriptional regulator [Methylobacterium sp. SD274]MBO1019337.1 helix-turn-helix transcriptional regulator [Methylobacterium sp. SD274]